MNRLYNIFCDRLMPDAILYDGSLSLRAKGLWVYLRAEPDGCRFSVEDIAKHSKEGVSAIRNTLKELEQHGLLRKTPVKNKNGQWRGYNYVLYGNDKYPFRKSE